MKKILGILLCIGLLVMPVMSQALSLYDVGGVDSFLFNTSLGNSGDQTELDWVNEKLGTNYTMDEFNKIETNNGNGWIGIDNYASIYAYNVENIQPAYFLVKIGAKKDDSDTFLYKNIGDLGWAVINLVGESFTIKEVGKLSHLDTFGSTPVPEPATMLLLGSGLVGLAGFGRRKFIK